jgi:hypothetical protein
VPAFHESFGDCWALLTALSDPAIRAQVVQDAPDLRAQNILEANSAYLSDAIKQVFGSVAAAEPRHAFNDFQWQLPSTLPPGDFHDPPGVLSVEPHSFSRVFTGGFYDTLTGIFAATPGPRPDALLQAAQTAGKLLLAAAQAVSMSPRLFRALGLAMLEADRQQNAGRNREALAAAFANHALPLGTGLALSPEAALDGPAPTITPEAVKLSPATVKDLRARIQAAPGAKLALAVRNLAGTNVAEAVNRREVALGPVDKRLKDVVACATEPVLVGSSGARAALFGTLPDPNKTEDEVRAFVKALVRHGRIQFDAKKPAARPRTAIAAPAKAPGPIPTHVVRERKGKKVLERARFLCR